MEGVARLSRWGGGVGRRDERLAPPRKAWWWLVLRPLPLLVLIGTLLFWMLSGWRSESTSLDESGRLRWLLVLAGASLVIGWAVFLATPSVSLISPVKDQAVNKGRTELSQ